MISYKYRIYPTHKQIYRFNNQFNLAQEMYNASLQYCKDYYKQTGNSITKYLLDNHIKEIKDNDERFKQVYSQVLQNISDRIFKSYQDFFRRVKEKKQGKNIKVGFPRFKKFYKSITYPQFGFKFKNERRLYISKVGNVPIVTHRPIEGTIKTLTIKRMSSKRWYTCFSIENKKTVVHPHKGKQTGIDVGIEWFTTLSDGSHTENPRYLIKSEKKLKKLQRKLSCKKKDSNNRRKARIRVARIYEKTTNQRLDFLHKWSRSLVDYYGFIAVEKLDIKGMVKNHRLAKHINDASWNNFIQMLSYKAESAGKVVVCVNPNGTSQICSNCGTNVPKTLGERIHNCPICGFEIHRDVNSAINILNRATVGLTGSYACGDRVRPSVKKASVNEPGTICE